MTLEELDKALETVFALDFNDPACVGIRDRILESYGRSLLNSRDTMCSRCWIKGKKGCQKHCRYNLPLEPIQAARQYLGSPNDVNVFPFLCMFVIPLYEKETGNTGTLAKLAKSIKRKAMLKKYQKK
jgi:hypothetical protein